MRNMAVFFVCREQTAKHEKGRILTKGKAADAFHECKNDTGEMVMTWLQHRNEETCNRYRTEWKYRCREEELAAVERRCRSILPYDEHADEKGNYTIHSLYFDDYWDSCVRENEAKLQKRYKYRLRYYDADTAYIRLERKEKYMGRCHKESCVISYEQCVQLMRGEYAYILWHAEQELLRRFSAEALARGYLPTAIVTYERTTFTEPVTNIRITLDRNVAVSNRVDRFLDGDEFRYPVQEAGEHVLEVKFDTMLPGYIKHIVSGTWRKTNFSKYYLGRLKLQEMGEIKWAR